MFSFNIFLQHHAFTSFVSFTFEILTVLTLLFSYLRWHFLDGMYFGSMFLVLIFPELMASPVKMLVVLVMAPVMAISMESIRARDWFFLFYVYIGNSL